MQIWWMGEGKELGNPSECSRPKRLSPLARGSTPKGGGSMLIPRRSILFGDSAIGSLVLTLNPTEMIASRL